MGTAMGIMVLRDRQLMTVDGGTGRATPLTKTARKSRSKRRYKVMKEHRHEARVRWAGKREGTTSGYRAYSREHEAVVEGKPVLRLSAGGAFLVEGALYDAEDLLVIALSGCHLPTYLAKCARVGLRALSYEDEASRTMAGRRRVPL